MSETGRNQGESTHRGRKQVANESRKADGVPALHCDSASKLGMKHRSSITSSLYQTFNSKCTVVCVSVCFGFLLEANKLLDNERC